MVKEFLLVDFLLDIVSWLLELVNTWVERLFHFFLFGFTRWLRFFFLLGLCFLVFTRIFDKARADWCEMWLLGVKTLAMVTMRR